MKEAKRKNIEDMHIAPVLRGNNHGGSKVGHSREMSEQTNNKL